MKYVILLSVLVFLFALIVPRKVPRLFRRFGRSVGDLGRMGKELATGVELVDFSFNNNATNLGEIVLNIAIRKWNAAVRIALDSVTFVVASPNWQEAPQLVALFDQVSKQIRDVVGASPVAQESALTFHVTPGAMDFGKATANLVKKEVLGEGVFYGLSRYRCDGVVTIDRSVNSDGAAVVRIQRTIASDALFGDVALELYNDEVAALRLLGIPDVT